MEDLLKFYNTINKIKHIERKGWKGIGVRDIKDTIASHSFGSALIAWIVAKKENIDENKLIKMLLIHDLIMAYVYDYTPEEDKYKSKRNLENLFAEKLFEIVPNEIKKEFVNLFTEYQEERTEEAILARECDKLDTLFQAHFYKLEKNKLKQFYASYKNKFKSKTGKKIFNDLRKSLLNSLP